MPPVDPASQILQEGVVRHKLAPIEPEFAPGFNRFGWAGDTLGKAFKEGGVLGTIHGAGVPLGMAGNLLESSQDLISRMSRGEYAYNMAKGNIPNWIEAMNAQNPLMKFMGLDNPQFIKEHAPEIIQAYETAPYGKAQRAQATFNEYLNPVQQIAGDIITDPISYLGFGLPKAGAKVLSDVAMMANRARRANQAKTGVFPALKASGAGALEATAKAGYVGARGLQAGEEALNKAAPYAFGGMLGAGGVAAGLSRVDPETLKKAGVDPGILMALGAPIGAGLFKQLGRLPIAALSRATRANDVIVSIQNALANLRTSFPADENPIISLYRLLTGEPPLRKPGDTSIITKPIDIKSFKDLPKAERASQEKMLRESIQGTDYMSMIQDTSNPLKAADVVAIYKAAGLGGKVPGDIFKLSRQEASAARPPKPPILGKTRTLNMGPNKVPRDLKMDPIDEAAYMFRFGAVGTTAKKKYGKYFMDETGLTEAQLVDHATKVREVARLYGSTTTGSIDLTKLPLPGKVAAQAPTGPVAQANEVPTTPGAVESPPAGPTTGMVETTPAVEPPPALAANITASPESMVSVAENAVARDTNQILQEMVTTGSANVEDASKLMGLYSSIHRTLKPFVQDELTKAYDIMQGAVPEAKAQIANDYWSTVQQYSDLNRKAWQDHISRMNRGAPSENIWDTYREQAKALWQDFRGRAQETANSDWVEIDGQRIPIPKEESLNAQQATDSPQRPPDQLQRPINQQALHPGEGNQAAASKGLKFNNYLASQGDVLYHSSGDKLTSGKPEFDAYFGDAEWASMFKKSFGHNEYRVVLPQGSNVIRLDPGNPEGYKLMSEVSSRLYPEDTGYAQRLLDGDPDAISEFYDIWTDKEAILPIIREHGLDGAEFLGEYILTKEAISKLKTVGELKAEWRAINKGFQPTEQQVEATTFHIQSILAKKPWKLTDKDLADLESAGYATDDLSHALTDYKETSIADRLDTKSVLEDAWNSLEKDTGATGPVVTQDKRLLDKLAELTKYRDAKVSRIAANPNSPRIDLERRELANVEKELQDTQRLLNGEKPVGQNSDGSPRWANDRQVGGMQQADQLQVPTFYSALRRGVESTKQDKFQASQLLGALKGIPGIKKEEVYWSGLEDYLTAKGNAKVTKQEVLDYLDQNNVKVEEVVLGDQLKPGYYVVEKPGGGWSIMDPNNNEVSFGSTRASAISNSGVVASTKYASYIQPFQPSTGYRELLLTLPTRFSQLERLNVLRQKFRNKELTWPEREELNKLEVDWQQFEGFSRYQSPHWDQPNVLAHVRFDTRVDDLGKKVLFIHEIQSDWGQAGAKHGFGGQQNTYANGFRETQTVPDMPFKGSNWVNLSMKRMVRWAAENGYDKIAWTTGAQQAERYGGVLKHIGEIRYRPEDKQLVAIGQDGQRHVIDGVTPDNMAEYVGTQNAERVLQGIPTTGLDLTVRTSMTGKDKVYDEMAVQSANAIGKKFGTKAGESQVAIESRKAKPERFLAEENQWEPELDEVPGRVETVHSLPITPAMRDSVLNQGQTQFYGKGLTTDEALQSTRAMVGPAELIDYGGLIPDYYLKEIGSHPYIQPIFDTLTKLHDLLEPLAANLAKTLGQDYRPSRFTGFDTNPGVWGANRINPDTNNIRINIWDRDPRSPFYEQDLIGTMLHELAHNSYIHGPEESLFQRFADDIKELFQSSPQLWVDATAQAVHARQVSLENMRHIFTDGRTILEEANRNGVQDAQGIWSRRPAGPDSIPSQGSLEGAQPTSSQRLPESSGSLGHEPTGDIAGSTSLQQAPGGPTQPIPDPTDLIRRLAPQLPGKDLQILTQHKDVITNVLRGLMDDRTAITGELERLSQAGYIDPTQLGTMSLKDAIKRISSLAQDPATGINSKEWTTLAKKYDHVGDILLKDPTGLVGQLIAGPIREAMGAGSPVKLPHQWATRPAIGALLGLVIAGGTDNQKDAEKFMAYGGIAGASTHPAAKAIFKSLALATARYPIMNAVDALVKNSIHGIKTMWGSVLEREAARLGNVPHEVSRSNLAGLNEGQPVSELEVSQGALAGTNIAARTAGGAAIGAAFPQDEDTRLQSTIAGAGIAAGLPRWTKWVKIAAAETEKAARTSAWIKGRGDYQEAQYPKFREQMLRAVGDPTTKTKVAALVDGESGHFTPEWLHSTLQKLGVNEDTALDLSHRWANIGTIGDQKGAELAGHIQFNYKYTTADEFLKEFIPFHFYATRNLPWYAEHMAQHPVIANLVLSANRLSEDDRKKLGLTNRFLGMVVLNDKFGRLIADFLGGRPGSSAMDLLPVLISVTGQTRDPADWGGESGLSQILNYGALAGINPYPGYQAMLQASGTTGAKPGPGFIPQGQYLRNFPGNVGIDPEKPIRELGAQVQGLATGAEIDPEAMSTSKIRARIAEMATEAGTPGAYDQFMDQPDSEVYKKAAADTKREAVGTTSASFIFPVRPKFLSDTEQQVRATRKEHFPQADITAEAGAPPDKTYLEAYAQAAKAHPEGATYSRAYQSPGKRELSILGNKFENLSSPQDMETFRAVQEVYSAGMDPSYTPEQKQVYRATVDNIFQKQYPEAKATYDKAKSARDAWLADPANAPYAAYWKRNAEESAKGNQDYNLDAYLAEVGQPSSSFDLPKLPSPAQKQVEAGNVQQGSLKYTLQQELSEYMDPSHQTISGAGSKWKTNYLILHPFLATYLAWRKSQGYPEVEANNMSHVDAFLASRQNSGSQPAAGRTLQLATK